MRKINLELELEYVIYRIRESIVIALLSLYRAAVSALFSLVVLLIICSVKLHVVLLFEQINKERTEKQVAYTKMFALSHDATAYFRFVVFDNQSEQFFDSLTQKPPVSHGRRRHDDQAFH